MGNMGVLVYVWQVGDVYVSLWVSGYGFMGGVGMGVFVWFWVVWVCGSVGMLVYIWVCFWCGYVEGGVYGCMSYMGM